VIFAEDALTALVNWEKYVFYAHCMLFILYSVTTARPEETDMCLP